MSSISQDPNSYYAVLGLAPGADLAAIKAAYRARVKAVHPDRNRSAGARDEFQRLTEAYRVLRGVVHGAGDDIDADEPTPSAPLCCTRCGKVTAQPRHIVFHRVKSFLLWARRMREEGIFCRDCADRAAVQASTATWAWGWWSPPGLLLSPIALLRNLMGGTRSRIQNARLLIRQSRAFLAQGEVELARGLAEQAQPFARLPRLRDQVEALLSQTAEAAGSRRMKDRWRAPGGVFFAQLLPLLALPMVLAVFALIAFAPARQPVSASAGIVVQPPSVGDIRHVAVSELKLRQAPLAGAPVLALLDRFQSVEVVETPADSEWVKVRMPSGIAGYVQARSLYAGSGSRLKTAWCAENRGSPPQAGEVLKRRASGEQRILIHNDGRKDGVVKLKTMAGNTVLSVYVPATYHLGVGGIPEGTYRIEFATGYHFSRACGIFIEDMQAQVMPYTLTFHHVSPNRARALTAIPEVSLVTQPGDPRQPQGMDADSFVADE